jgi:hypothetical protein
MTSQSSRPDRCRVFSRAIFLCLLAAASPRAYSAVEYRLSADGVLDNREYGSEPFADQTIFFARPEAEIGVSPDKYHKIRGGLGYTLEFGAPASADMLYPLFYYLYDGENARFRFGAFPRAGAIDPPEWLFGPDAAYGRPFVQGAAASIGKRGAEFGAWVDWTGRQADTTREAFLFGYGAKYRRGAFFARHDFMMYHLARSSSAPLGENIRDNGGASIEIGAAPGGVPYLDSLSLSAGAIASADRERGEYDWRTGGGGFVSGFASGGFLGIRGFAYYGGPTLLLWGGEHYRSGLSAFGRLDLIAQFAKKERAQAELFWSLHFFDGKIGHSQHFLLHAEIAGPPTGKKKKKGFSINVKWD